MSGVPYQTNIAEVEEAEGSGGDGFGLDEVLQDLGGRGLDVTVVLDTDHQQTVGATRVPVAGADGQTTHQHLVQQLVDEGKVHLHRLLRQAATVVFDQSR